MLQVEWWNQKGLQSRILMPLGSVVIAGGFHDAQGTFGQIHQEFTLNEALCNIRSQHEIINRKFFPLKVVHETLSGQLRL